MGLRVAPLQLADQASVAKTATSTPQHGEDNLAAALPISASSAAALGPGRLACRAGAAEASADPGRGRARSGTGSGSP